MSGRPGYHLDADRPIERRAQDRLGRVAFAAAIAQQLATAPADAGFVVGLVGPWGSGKTSILNLVAEALGTEADVVVLRFNPWFFSGTEQLLFRFFGELASQLLRRKDERLRELGARLANYGEILTPLGFVPVLGPWLAGVGGLAKAIRGMLKPGATASVESQRTELDKALRDINRRFVILVDDLDRLRSEEIRDVVRLVRLVADFPQTVYLLAFDRPRVEDALGSGDPARGRAELEKILQVTHNVPQVREPELAVFLTKELQTAITGHPEGPFDEHYWSNMFTLAIRPLFKTVRDTRRYVNAIPVALETIGDEVALVDVLALEAVRTLLPDVYDELPTCSDALTAIGERNEPETIKKERLAALNTLLEKAGAQAEPIRAMLRLVFPSSERYLGNTFYGSNSAQRWRRERRVAHPDVFHFYLERSLPSDVLPASRVQELFDALSDENRLGSILSSLSPELLEHALGRLEDYEDDYPATAVEPAVRTLMGQLPRLRQGTRRIFDFDASLQLTRVVLRLLRRVESEDERAEIVRKVLPGLDSISARLELVELVGHRQGAGHKLVSEAAAAHLEQDVDGAILALQADTAAGERDLMTLISWSERRNADPARATIRELVRDDRVFRRLIASALHESHSQAITEVAVRTQQSLPWESLESLLGPEVLKERAASVNSVDNSQKREVSALELAKRYAEGWRPPERW